MAFTSTRSVTVGSTVVDLVQGDITCFEADAIVNAANSRLAGGGGVDGAIHAAGGPEIMEECRAIIAEIGRLPPGDAVVTTGGRLPAKHVIHTVGPVWHGGGSGEPDILASSYRRSLEEAHALGLASVGFASISTGVYGYPVQQAARIALSTIRDFLLSHPDTSLRRITMVLFTPSTLHAFEAAFDEIMHFQSSVTP